MGTAHVGGTLTAKVAMPAAKGTAYVFQWQTQKKVTVKKKTVTRWVAISRASKATFVPTAGLKGSSVRACVKAKGTKSAWKCSGAKVVAAAPSESSPGASPAPAPLNAARTPVFGTPTPAATGFTVQISNYDAQWTWGASATNGGSAAVSTTGLVTVTGVAPGTSSQVTVTTTRNGYVDGSASVSATSPDALSVSYFTQRFITGSASTLLPATTTGGSGTKRFEVTAGTLPDGITFDQGTGTFTGPAASAWNFRATQIAAGGSRTCALTTSGGVKCWGQGNYGQLGDGGITDQSAPVDVCVTSSTPGACNGTPLRDVTQIAAGRNHACALTTSGGVKCWGYGGEGQVGNGANPTTQSTPVDVVATGQNQGGTALSGITQISAGGFHTCALTISGGVKCWGYGFYGELGDGARSDRSTPVDVCVTATAPGTCTGTPLRDVTQITGGYLHTCALTTSGGVKCWGRGAVGQLGNGDTPFARTTPVDVTRSGEQPGFPAVLSVTVTDDTGSWTLGRVVLGTK